MDINNIWNSFLDKIKTNISPMSFETWFHDTKLVELKDNKATVVVPMHVHKKHLKENYINIINELFAEITSTNFQLEFITEEEFEKNIEIDTDIVGIPSVNFVSNINPQYSFENFVVGDSNRFAHATALVVAEKPGTMYNPLFIYANSGLGKTHLMHSIGNYLIENSKKKVLYVTSDQFVSDFIGITKRSGKNTNFDEVDEFKKKYRDIDVLMIDDIQYFSNANQTQQEFFNTFNNLYSNNKQIIISSDRSPDDLKLLEDRLRTRFNWGLTIDILPPDFTLRMNIINKKLEANGMVDFFPEDVKEYIANNCITDIRKIEGSITRVVAYSTMMNESIIDLNLAIESLKDSFSKCSFTKNKIEQVQQLVATYYNVSVEDLKGKKRTAVVTVPRQIAMYICRTFLEETLPKIGIEFGGKDHTTVIHSVDKISKEIKNNNALLVEINKIISQLK